MRASVVIPCHNSLRFLPETLASVLDQELPDGVIDDVEVVLVDDGGSDDLAGWAAGLDEPRVRVVRQENAGVSAARNRGVAESEGDLIAFCDSDDLWTPTTLASLARCFVSAPDVGLAYAWYDVVDSEGRPTGRLVAKEWEGDVWEDLITFNPIAASAVAVRRAVLDDVGGFAVNRDRFPIDVEDWELWIRIAARHRVAVVRSVGAHHRRHDSNSSSDLESLESAYQHLLDVVFEAAPPHRQRFRPLMAASMELRMASHWINDRHDRREGLARLRSAAAHDPQVRRDPEYWKLRLSCAALVLGGARGHAALRGLNRLVRRSFQHVRTPNGENSQAHRRI